VTREEVTQLERLHAGFREGHQEPRKSEGLVKEMQVSTRGKRSLKGSRTLKIKVRVTNPFHLLIAKGAGWKRPTKRVHEEMLHGKISKGFEGYQHTDEEERGEN